MCTLRNSQYAITAIIILCILISEMPVRAQTPCSISRVNFYPQTAYAGETVSVISQVIFTCGPAYNYVWTVRVELSNPEHNITSTGAVPSVYASYQNTVINVTNTFTAPSGGGPLSLSAHVFIISQATGVIFASSSSTLNIQVQPVATAYTTPTSPVQVTTTSPAPTTSLTTSSMTQSGFSLSMDQVYVILTMALIVLFVVVIAVRLRQTLRKSRGGTPKPGPPAT